MAPVLSATTGPASNSSPPLLPLQRRKTPAHSCVSLAQMVSNPNVFASFTREQNGKSPQALCRCPCDHASVAASPTCSSKSSATQPPSRAGKSHQPREQNPPYALAHTVL